MKTFQLIFVGVIALLYLITVMIHIHCHGQERDPYNGLGAFVGLLLTTPIFLWLFNCILNH